MGCDPVPETRRPRFGCRTTGSETRSVALRRFRPAVEFSGTGSTVAFTRLTAGAAVVATPPGRRAIYCTITTKPLLGFSHKEGVMSDRDQIRREKLDELQARATADDDAAETVDSRGEPVHVENADHFDELVAEGGVVLADFYADWCGPCKMLEPVVEELAAETDATVAKIDVDQLQGLAQQYRVQGIPTMYLFAGGETVEQMVGVQQKDELRSLIEQYA